MELNSLKEDPGFGGKRRKARTKFGGEQQGPSNNDNMHVSYSGGMATRFIFLQQLTENYCIFYQHRGMEGGDPHASTDSFEFDAFGFGNSATLDGRRGADADWASEVLGDDKKSGPPPLTIEAPLGISEQSNMSGDINFAYNVDDLPRSMSSENDIQLLANAHALGKDKPGVRKSKRPGRKKTGGEESADTSDELKAKVKKKSSKKKSSSNSADGDSKSVASKVRKIKSKKSSCSFEDGDARSVKTKKKSSKKEGDIRSVKEKTQTQDKTHKTDDQGRNTSNSDGDNAPESSKTRTKTRTGASTRSPRRATRDRQMSVDNMGKPTISQAPLGQFVLKERRRARRPANGGGASVVSRDHDGDSGEGSGDDDDDASVASSVLDQSRIGSIRALERGHRKTPSSESYDPNIFGNHVDTESEGESLDDVNWGDPASTGGQGGAGGYLPNFLKGKSFTEFEPSKSVANDSQSVGGLGHHFAKTFAVRGNAPSDAQSWHGDSKGRSRNPFQSSASLSGTGGSVYELTDDDGLKETREIQDDAKGGLGLDDLLNRSRSYRKNRSSASVGGEVQNPTSLGSLMPNTEGSSNHEEEESPWDTMRESTASRGELSSSDDEPIEIGKKKRWLFGRNKKKLK